MKKIITAIISLILGFSLVTVPVYAECPEGYVETAILGENHCFRDDGKGGGIIHILELVVDIMTVGIGVLGVIGIVIAGTQYLTAGDKEDQVKKAKRRIFEIVIGLAAYALIYAILKWLLPSFPS